MNRCHVLAGLLLALGIPLTLQAQETERRRGPLLSLSGGPAAIIETYRSATRSGGGDWYAGGSLGGRLTLPITTAVGVVTHAIVFRAWDGAAMETVTAGLEVRLGANRQIPIALSAGIVREPENGDCLDVCRRRRDVAPTLTASASYVIPAGRWELGPDLTWTRALNQGVRIYSLHAGIRVTTTL